MDSQTKKIILEYLDRDELKTIPFPEFMKEMEQYYKDVPILNTIEERWEAIESEFYTNAENFMNVHREPMFITIFNFFKQRCNPKI